MLDLPDDFRDVLVALSDAGADFVLIGGHAVAYHGHPRATSDMDILVRANGDNASRVFAALAAFGAPLGALDVTVEDFAEYDGVLQLGLPPNRIDILTKADGISFDQAIAGAPEIDVEGRRIRLIGLRALLANKRASGRHKDLADVEALEPGSDRQDRLY